LDADLRFVLFLGLLQDLQRLVLGRESGVRLRRRKLAFRLLHRHHRLRQQLADLRERRIALHQFAVDARQQPFDLLAQFPLRQLDDLRVLLQLLRRQPLLVAVHVVRGGDDLTLLF
jgi:hypothetical protein